MNLVLDLDQTLICSVNNSDINIKRLKMFNEYNDLKYKIYYFGDSDDLIWGCIRPGLQDFIKWATEYFNECIVFSAGSSLYVKEIVRVIWNECDLPYPKIIFSRERCTGEKENTHKIMDNLFNYDVAKSLNITKYNTVILDDNLITVSKNPDNSIFIPPFSPNFSRNGIANVDDDVLPRVREWFESLPKMNKKFDIRKYKKDLFEKPDE